MNAAFLLVTSAMLVGQPGAPAPQPAPVASSCGHDCGCDGFGHKLRDRLKGMFSRDCSDTCQTTACRTHHVHTSIFRSSSCDTGCQPKRWTWTPRCREHKCHQHSACRSTGCATTGCNDACAGGGGILAKLRGRFSRGGDCCDTGCSSNGTAAPAPMKAEPVGQPAKKLPVDPPKAKTKPKAEEVRAVPQPTPFAVSPAVPSVEIVPVPAPAPLAPAPRVEGDRRDPF